MNYESETQPVAETNDALDPFQTDGPYRVTWSIDGDEDSSPARAAANAWTQNFNRGAAQPCPDDACVFTVTDSKTGRSVDIDLSEEEFAHLFY
ncbi:hypothetical protein [Arthrobacter bambusae]|uniref:Uncharacterized protein n=1 Tax=Arthrobacter bambusae TaxID=1338426 RepID=A0AAW8D5K7_9MICC|nr:hypothetical protein [Arthrobacter bambusae]MDP9903158.1 hypothetical protein [Arthrobacter bambusae]MDQ0128848.1 hypothetical protein [Arthrobacter bambusae]MDQ0180189.1 hypothetical protein [Arthrobacter bambusae]